MRVLRKVPRDHGTDQPGQVTGTGISIFLQIFARATFETPLFAGKREHGRRPDLLEQYFAKEGDCVRHGAAEISPSSVAQSKCVSI